PALAPESWMSAGLVSIACPSQSPATVGMRLNRSAATRSPSWPLQRSVQRPWIAPDTPKTRMATAAGNNRNTDFSSVRLDRFSGGAVRVLFLRRRRRPISIRIVRTVPFSPHAVHDRAKNAHSPGAESLMGGIHAWHATRVAHDRQ